MAFAISLSNVSKAFWSQLVSVSVKHEWNLRKFNIRSEPVDALLVIINENLNILRSHKFLLCFFFFFSLGLSAVCGSFIYIIIIFQTNVRTGTVTVKIYSMLWFYFIGWASFLIIYYLKKKINNFNLITVLLAIKVH